MKPEEKAKQLVERLTCLTRPRSVNNKLKVQMHPEHSLSAAKVFLGEITHNVLDKGICPDKSKYWREVRNELFNIKI